ncbi:sulfatase [Planctomicrobium sp.]|nr:sulfatase [Planctomicrobium sp.]MDA7527816.1 sulfatase [bacterium]MDB4733107.1 sulfatase [Planctomicrobium sp.]
MRILLFELLVLTCCTTSLVVASPNILMIAVDDLRPMLGCYGDVRIRTPNIDRLAARSILFERAYCQVAKCGPSRLSLMTGLRPASINVFGHSNKEVNTFRKRRPDAISLARFLKNNGYETRSLGKIDHDGWQIAEDWSAVPFAGREKEMLEVYDGNKAVGSSVIADRFQCPVMQSPAVPDDYFFCGRMTNEALKIYRKHDSEKPLFMAIGYRRPHLPFVAPKRFHDLYTSDESWLAPNPNPPIRSPVMAWFNSDGYVGAAERFNVTMPDEPSRDDWKSWNGFEMRSYLGVPVQGEINQNLQLQLIHAYAACVSYVDAQIGKLLNEVDLDNTIILLWSDHGWHLGEQSAWGKMTNFEIATRVPLLISVPGLKPGPTKRIAELVDLYPTVCDLLHLTPPSHLEGESLIDILNNPMGDDNSFALSEYPRFKNQWHGHALRTNQYRFVQWRDKESRQITKRELYDHQTDPFETKNLAGFEEFGNIVSKLEMQLNEVFR